MAQFLRPDANIAATGIIGSFTAIDETPASDADFIYGADGGGNVYECGLSNPTGTPANGNVTLRVRLAEIDGGVLGNGSGAANPITVEIYEGATQRFTSTRSPGGAWTTYTSTISITVTDWNDLRVRITDTGHGGNPNSRRAMGVSWVELETADPAPPAIQGAAAFSGSGSFTASGVRKILVSATLSGAGSFTASGLRKTRGSATLSATGSMTANGTVAGQVILGAMSATGGGTISAKPGLIARASSAMAGASAVTVSGLKKIVGAFQAAGSGIVSATARLRASASAALGGQSSIAATAKGTEGRSKRKGGLVLRGVGRMGF